MIATLGLAALWLAAALAVLQLVGAIVTLRRADNPLGAVVRSVAAVQGGLVAVSFACLIWVFLETDLSVKLVSENSHSLKPLLFKFAATWGNHEGSMLLWVSIMALGGACVALFERRLSEPAMLATLAAQAFVSIGFYAFLLIASNPFARLDPVPAEGRGLNPLLQDTGLAFHPPTLYIGYVGLSIAFSFAVGALITREVSPAFARAMRPWVLGAWIFLTLGIVAGSYWAYYTLGWGGWWFWDPVENASLMPWLAATALLHSVSVLAARNALRAWTVMLGVIAFSMSMVGTFLVRSGVLVSVHAFAVDPLRGQFILALLAINIGAALTVFALRAASISEGERFALASRETALVFNNVMLSGILGIVLVGTLYPLLAEAMGARVSVGPPYFNAASAIFAVPMLLVLCVGPLLGWRRDRLSRLTWKLWLPLAAAISAAAIALTQGVSVLSALGLGLGAALIPASMLPLVGRNLRTAKLPLWGMVTAHLGVGLALIGMASDSAFTREKLIAINVGQTVAVGPWQIKLARIAPVAGPNWTALEAGIEASYDGATPIKLAPQDRAFWAPPQQVNHSALSTRWNGQLYVVLGQQAEDGRWQLRLWWKPFVILIWLGGLMVALGGLLALLGRVASDLRRTIAIDKIAFRRKKQGR
ncbi:heme lyase CcmF/NrfE family subunit [Novosphingobium sp.]|uniref:heme lyase CcmF/NrfE family subunit n=1 Tax=Novosphingobium sp. TaxID=1874826 RepID=UPI00286A4EE9|nr:heme lyase CcmF/NrfE family subunit [Novosphingobium sp.]